MGVIIFNGQRSSDFNILVEHPPGETFPERDYDAQHVPGRDGDIILMSKNESFKNRERTYEIALGSYYNTRFEVLVSRLSDWLFTSSGYAILEDSYSPDVYRMAFYSGSTEIENLFDAMGRGQLVFTCKPQKYLKTGDELVSISRSGTLRNATNRVSKPIITVRGSGAGQLTVGESTIEISEVGGSLIINSELEDIYDSTTTNRNGDVSLPNRRYPKLYPGLNTISYSGGITSVEVQPKWWRL